MLSIKTRDKKDIVTIKVNGYSVTFIETMAVLEKIMSLIKDEFNLSDTQISDYLIDYRNSLKEVD